MTFTEVQCNQIQSPALNALLPKLHINQKTACSIVHGPLLYGGGMNLPHLFTSQGLHQLKFLLGHLHAQDKTWKLLLIGHGYIQLLVGIWENFLNVAYKTYHHWVCPSWFTSVWQYMDKQQLNIDIKRAWLPPLPEGPNINLMSYFVSQGLSIAHLQSINKCRVYLQILLLADIVSADGKFLIWPVLQGNRLIDQKSILVWPEQEISSRSNRTIWEDSIQTFAKGDNLHQPLDMARYQSHQTWSWFMDSSYSLYNQTEDSWVSYLPMTNRSKNNKRDGINALEALVALLHLVLYSKQASWSRHRLLLRPQGCMRLLSKQPIE